MGTILWKVFFSLCCSKKNESIIDKDYVKFNVTIKILVNHKKFSVFKIFIKNNLCIEKENYMICLR